MGGPICLDKGPIDGTVIPFGLRCTLSAVPTYGRAQDLLLISFALEEESQAQTVCQTISTGHPGFWPIALKIPEFYPENPNLRSALVGGIEQMGRVITRNPSPTTIKSFPQAALMPGRLYGASTTKGPAVGTSSKEGIYGFGLDKSVCRSWAGAKVHFELLMLAYNLMNWFKEEALRRGANKEMARTTRRKLFWIQNWWPRADDSY
jgi:hypothetical protein